MSANIFLIGFMGSGKTHLGKIWAEKNNLPFYDLDHLIEEATQMTVHDIFEEKGEEEFRELEKIYLREFENKENFILACGGGTPCFNDNMDWMREHGKVFYLKASPEFILKNVTNETLKRPLLKNVTSSELLSTITKKIDERQHMYSLAHTILNAEELEENSLSSFLAT